KLSLYKTHILKSVALFLPSLAIQLYLVGNKVILGAFAGYKQSGIFENANKIITVSLTAIASIGTVTLPRLTNAFSKKNKQDFNKVIKNSFTFLNAFSFPMMFGLILISSPFSLMFFGNSFAGAGLILCVLSPIFVFNSWSTITGYQFLLSTGQIKKYTFSTVVSSTVSFVICLLLAPKFGALGAAIALLAAEGTISIVQIIVTFDQIHYKNFVFDGAKYFVASLLSWLLTNFVVEFVHVRGIYLIACQAILFILFYVILVCFFKSDIIQLAMKIILSFF
ncbi:hypothetical protein Q757_04615, partial [Oenococcus alcoholitolerans]